MNQKIVSAIDENGYYIGQVIADESPLEPGVYLLPGNTVDVNAPELIDGYKYMLSDGDWVKEEIIIVDEQESEVTESLTVLVPTSVTIAQAQLALLEYGYLDTVEAAVSNMPRAAQIKWGKAQSVDRSDSLTVAIASILELSDDDLDSLFTLAATL